MQFELLEHRLLLSSVVYENQILTIIGSPGRDRIRVDILMDPAGSGASVHINGRNYPVRNFPNLSGPFPHGVVVESGLGDDTITLSNLEGIPATIRAGGGNDLIRGFTVESTIFGGNGNDVISLSTSSVPVTVFGGDGNDHISVLADAPQKLHGGNGNDTLIGAGGDDQLFGDAGNDALKGGEGIDTYFGGDGNDRIYSSDSNADEPVDAGEGKDRAFFPADCSRPLDNFAGTEDVLVLGTHHPYRVVLCGCC